MPILPNQRHEAFAQALAKGKSASDAYIAAGYKDSRSAASRLSTNVNIVARVAELQSMAAEIAVVDKAWVLERLRENVETCMTMDFVRGPDGVPTLSVTHNPAAANKALELLGKELGMFKEKVELTGKDGKDLPVPVSPVTIFQLPDNGRT